VKEVLGDLEILSESYTIMTL